MQDEQVDRNGKSVWPVVVGILALVFGLAGVLNNLVGAVVPLLMEGFYPP